jgi:hypothetical protein
MQRSSGSEPYLDTSFGGRRKIPRYTFIAITEIVTGSSQSILAKTRKISCKGCYVETPIPLPVDTSINLVISRDERTFAAKGRVIYSHEGSGMGIIFLDPTGDQLQTLDYWLAERPRNSDVV